MNPKISAHHRALRHHVAAELLKLEEDMQAATLVDGVRDPIVWANLKERQQRLDARFRHVMET